jgi:alkylated DNA nucleotide flippase Atl1
MNIEILRDKVFDYLLGLPQEKITTYKQIGDIFGVHPRKIGKIIKGNEHTQQFPCYKVLETKDKIGFYNGR